MNDPVWPLIAPVLAPDVSLIWVAHVGFDRLVGYGFQFDSGFKGTHLSMQSTLVAAIRDVDEESTSGRPLS